ncbi:MAG: hypothetical protein ORO03_09945 [Alphaproteobacteria bacterium]|nr:hypothetical protein [Alphaproteobacteria bacterium]
MAACIREALTHAPTGGHVAACEAVAASLEAGRWPTAVEAQAAEAAA